MTQGKAERKNTNAKGGRSTISKLLYVALYAILMFAGMELLVRLYWIEAPATLIVGGNHAVYHHVPSYMPDSELGRMDMRKRKHTPDKAAGLKRIVFMGDSYTFGLGAAENQTITSYFQNELDRRYGKGQFEVLNYGMISYSPIIEELLYNNVISNLKPDLVIMQLDPFDIQEDHIYSEMAEFDENGTTIAVNGFPPLHKGLKKSSLLRFFGFIFDTVRYGGNHVRPDLRMNLRSDFFYNTDKYQDWIDFSFSIIKRLNSRIRSDGAEFLLLTYPNPLYLIDKNGYEQAIRFISNDFKASRYESRIPEIVMESCLANGIDCLNLWPDFRREEREASPERGENKIFNDIDGHYTIWANRWVAKLIFNALQHKIGEVSEQELNDPDAP